MAKVTGKIVKVSGNARYLEKDKETAEELAKIANVDLNAYGMDMLKAGTDLSDFTPEQLINIDSKPFCTKGVKYQVAQVNTA